MRILHIDTEMMWRAGENQLWLFLDYLKDNEEITNYLVAKKGSAILERSENIINTFDVDLNWEVSPTSIVHIANICKTYNINIIIAYTPKAHGLAIMVKKIYPKVKLIVHDRSSESIGRGIFSKLKYRSSMVDKFIVTSSLVSDKLIRLGIDSQDIVIVKNACSGSEFIFRSKQDTKYVLSKKFELPYDVPLIGTVSHFSHHNRSDILFKSLEKLAQENISFFCLVAGDGPRRKELEDMCREYGIHHFVKFIGFMEDISQLLHAVDILAVVSSKKELGTVTLDAVWSDCCVVGACNNTQSDYLINGKTGFVSDLDDQEAFTNNLRKVVVNKELRTSLCEAAKTVTLKEHSLTTNVLSILGVCRDVLKNGRN